MVLILYQVIKEPPIYLDSELKDQKLNYQIQLILVFLKQNLKKIYLKKLMN